MNYPSNSQNQLTTYIKKNLEKGYNPDSLKVALIGQGYSRTAIEKAIESANREIAQSSQKPKEKPEITRKIFDENNTMIASQEINTNPGFFKRIWNKMFG